MTERGYYYIKLNDGQIGLRFSTWTFKRFCELKGNMPLSKLFETINEMTIGDIVDLILCAGECYAKEKKQPFNYTDFDAAGWIDAMGGLSGEGFAEMSRTLTSSFVDNSMDGVPHSKEGEADNKSADLA